MNSIKSKKVKEKKSVLSDSEIEVYLDQFKNILLGLDPNAIEYYMRGLVYYAECFHSIENKIENSSNMDEIET